VRISLIILCAALLATPISASAEQGEKSAVSGMGERVIRGTTNLVTGFAELGMQPYKGYKNGVSFISNRPASATVGTVLGVFRGITHTAGRTTSGAIELLGFWMAFPENDVPTGEPLDALYPWQDGTQYSFLEPNLVEGVTPVGRKLARGLTNTFGGWIDFPGQIAKGITQRNTVPSFFRGIWFAVSRTVHGATETATFLLPAPADTLRPHLDEKWGWSSAVDATQR